MPMTVKVGLAKKVGQPAYGSLGASCDIELELDGSLLFHDRDGLQEKVRAAYTACRQAVNEELASQNGAGSQPSAPQPADRPPSNTNGHERNALSPPGRDNPAASVSPAANSARHGHAGNNNGNRRAATTAQVRALHSIATRQNFNLTDLLRERFSLYRAEDLSITDASHLIDELNATHGSRA